MNEKVFVENLEKKFISEGFLTRKEVNAGYGIADLVLVKLDYRKHNIRKDCGQIRPLLQEAYFKILRHIPDIDDSIEPSKFDHILKKTRLSKPLLRYNLLRQLKSYGYIKEIEKDSYFKINGWMPMAKEIVAVEAKLRNWKRGFLQANRYKAFAEKVYLAVPKTIKNSVDIDLLKKHNVGLIIFDVESSEKKELVRAKKTAPYNEDKRHFVTEFFLPIEEAISYPSCSRRQ